MTRPSRRELERAVENAETRHESDATGDGIYRSYIDPATDVDRLEYVERDADGEPVRVVDEPEQPSPDDVDGFNFNITVGRDGDRRTYAGAGAGAGGDDE